MTGTVVVFLLVGCPLHVGALLQRRSQMQASTYVARTSSGKATWIKPGLGLHVAQIWDELHSKPWGLWFQPLLQNLYPAPTFPQLDCATSFLRNTLAFSIACKSNSGFLAFYFPLPPVFWAPRFSLQSSTLVRSSSCGSLAFCSSDRHRSLFLTQASRLETQDCPPYHAPRKQYKTVFRNWGSLWLCSRVPAASGTL